ncbi:putative ring finger domain protein [Erysiphe neolycopersici]|uniref:Putative ring finger domain protein n=1 Tax=Erysiphe neolycopersici TaxID=212602 RepID=A0A420HZE9_9PEZI|nr:putative ring finger domain protein [Erysiphe neolycopersici]
MRKSSTTFKEKNTCGNNTDLLDKNSIDSAASTDEQKQYSSRTCRICLEEVHPTCEVPHEKFSSIFHPAPQVRWISEEPVSGRLIRPCLCKGSQKFVHEGCLQQWRYSNPACLQKTNFWQCPTCKFQYRLERMKWSRFIISPVTRIGITLTVILATIFISGFFADYIINLYTNPLSTISYISSEGRATPYLEDDDSSWAIHFLKGFVSIGVLGIIKTTLAMSSWQWILKGFGVGRVLRRDQQPYDVLNGIPWIVVIFGVITFFVAIWKFVTAWTNLILEKVGESVADVQESNDEEEIEVTTLQTKTFKSQ